MLCKQCRRLFSASEDSNTFNSRRVHCVFLNKGMLDNPKPNIETVKKKLSKQKFIHPDKMGHMGNLIWVYTVCQDLFIERFKTMINRFCVV